MISAQSVLPYVTPHSPLSSFDKDLPSVFYESASFMY